MICCLWNCQSVTSVWSCVGTNQHCFRHISPNTSSCTSR